MARKSRKKVPVSDAPEEEKVWRAALYIRLSVEFNGKRGDSLETQRQLMEAYLALRPDIEIVEAYTDNGVTGRTFEREAFQRMLDDLEKGKINCVVVKDLSRLGRSAIDAGFYIEKYFPLHHIRFISVNDQYDSEENDASSHILLPVKNMMNEAYAADISRKVRAQQHQAMLEGAFVGGQPPYGYRKDPKNCHHLLVNEDTAPIVRQIFQWMADGTALNRIVCLLNARGIPSPESYQIQAGLKTSGKLRGSGKWQTRTLAKILSDPVYTGDMVQGRTQKIGHKQVYTAPEDWIIVPDTHEPLVSRELFANVQDARKKRAARYTETDGVPFTENILRGRIFCGDCGRPLHRARKRDRYFFRCIANGRVAPGTCRSSISYLPEQKLFDIILTLIRQEAEAIVGNSLRLKQRNAKFTARKAEIEHESAKLLREIERDRAYQASLYKNFSGGILTKTEYMELKEGYHQTIALALERVEQLQQQQRDLEVQWTSYFSLAERLASVDQDTALTALLVEQTIERVTVNSAEDVSIRFRFSDTFEALMEALGDG